LAALAWALALSAAAPRVPDSFCVEAGVEAGELFETEVFPVDLAFDVGHALFLDPHDLSGLGLCDEG
jgi:hypothetical protein